MLLAAEAEGLDVLREATGLRRQLRAVEYVDDVCGSEKEIGGPAQSNDFALPSDDHVLDDSTILEPDGNLVRSHPDLWEAANLLLNEFRKAVRRDAHAL